MKYYGVWAVRSENSDLGPAEAWHKNNGVIKVFTNLETAKKQAELCNESTRSPNISYYAKEMNFELIQSVLKQQKRDSLKLLKNTEVSSVKNYNSPYGVLNDLPVVFDIQKTFISNYENMVAVLGRDNKLYLGKQENCYNQRQYDNRDKSLVFITANEYIYSMLYEKGCVLSQDEALDEEIYSRTDYDEWTRLTKGVLKNFTQTQEFLFDGTPFVPLNPLLEEKINQYPKVSLGEIPTLRKFISDDIIGDLEAIMKINTKHYQSDFEYDKNTILKAVQSKHAEDKNLLWLSRFSGSYCFSEADVFIGDTIPHNTWNFYAEQTKNIILAYAVEISGTKNGKVMGTLHALDYAKHARHVKKSSQPLGSVNIQYADGTSIEVKDDYKHINRQDKEVENIHYLPKNPDLLKNILSNDRADRNKIRAASFKRHLSTLNKVINKESYVMTKLKDSEQTAKFTESQKSKSNKNKGIEL